MRYCNAVKDMVKPWLMRPKLGMSRLAKNLKKRAKELDLTDAEIARRTGLPVRRYGHYATGYREPNLDTLLVICEALDTTPNDLLGWQETGKGKKSAASTNQSKLNSLVASMSDEQIETFLKIGNVISASK